MMSNDKAIGSASVRLSKRITRVLNISLKPYSITTEQWSVLRALNESDQISQKELSDRADKDQATVTKILDLLEKNGFVERVANPGDRRSFLIKITEKGKKLALELTPYIEGIFSEMINGIEGEKLEIYKETLLLLESNLDRIQKEVNR